MSQAIPRVRGLSGFTTLPNSYKATASNLVGAATMSVAALIRGDLLENYGSARVAFANWDGSSGWQIRLDSNRIGWELRDGANATIQCYSQNWPSNGITARKLLLVVGTYSGTSMRVYVNAQSMGTAVTTAGVTAAAAGSRTTFGTNSNDSEALIDALVLGGAYSGTTALTQAQVSAMFEVCYDACDVVDTGVWQNLWSMQSQSASATPNANWTDSVGGIVLAKQGGALAFATGAARWL